VRQDLFWPQLTKAERAALSAAGTRRSYAKGDRLLCQGDRTRFIAVIQAGTVKVTTNSVDGLDTVLALCGQGAVIGEVAALTGMPRSSTVTALEPVVGLVVGPARLATVLRQHPGLRPRLERQMAQRLMDADQRRTDAGRPLAAARLAGLLADLAHRHGGRPAVLPLSQAELASLAAASDSSTARALRILRDEGLIRTARRSITIVRSDALRAFAEALAERGSVASML
jgi:CRP/FNR family transcriptional regulator, cyclic AMP receptor protein